MNFVHDALDWLGNLPGRLWRGLVRARMIGLVVALLAGAVALSLASLSRDNGSSAEDDRAGSVVIDERPAEPLTPVDPPTEYRIVYEVDCRARCPVAEYERRITVRRPFSAREESKGVTRISVFGKGARILASGHTSVLNTPPIAAVGDTSVNRDLVTRRERREIEGVDRHCDVYRIKGGTASQYRDLCVDAAGLILEDVSVSAATLRIRSLVTAIDTSPDIPSGTFDIPDVAPPPADQGGGSLLAVAPSSRPPVETWFELVDPPSGFDHRGRYAVIPPSDPQSDIGGAPPTVTSGPILEGTTGVVDVWTRGPAFVAVDQGGTRGRTAPFANDDISEQVDAGPLGSATYLPSFRGGEVRADLGDGRYVRVYGTVDRATLLRVARALTPVEGGELVYLER